MLIEPATVIPLPPAPPIDIDIISSSAFASISTSSFALTDVFSIPAETSLLSTTTLIPAPAASLPIEMLIAPLMVLISVSFVDFTTTFPASDIIFLSSLSDLMYVLTSAEFTIALTAPEAAKPLPPEPAKMILKLSISRSDVILISFFAVIFEFLI